MTKNEIKIKIGDKVRIKSTDIEDIVIDVCNGNVFLKESGYWNMNTLELVETLDRKTVFLRELQELLRKYDARIYDGDLYAIHIEIGYHDAKSEQADYLFYQSGNNEINADNIMDFDKE